MKRDLIIAVMAMSPMCFLAKDLGSDEALKIVCGVLIASIVTGIQAIKANNKNS